MLSKYLAGSILALNVANTLAGGVQFAGVNIAGFDFGCATDGTCTLSSVDAPLSTNGDGSNDGPGQMTHFTSVDKLNIFRLPVAWQYLVNDNLGGTLNAANFGKYDQLVQACLGTGAHCIIDIHNYARWNGNIIGQPGGPTNDQFSSLWSQLATKYAADTNVIMGLMNEPHDMPSITAWAASCQAAVTAIRKAGATSQMILLPGNDYTGGTQFVSGGSAAALATVTNLDGSTDNLIFDIHQYLDSDYSGTTSSCTINGISEAFQPLVTYLQGANRQALLSETGGGSSDPTCLTNLCEALDFLNENSAYFLGWVGWAAGSFDTSYVLSLTPTGATDVPLMTQCFAGKFDGGAGLNGNSTVPTPSGSPSSAVPSAPASSVAAPGPGAPASSATAPAPIASGTTAPPPIGTGSSSPTTNAPAPPPVESATSSLAPPFTTNAPVPPPVESAASSPSPLPTTSTAPIASAGPISPPPQPAPSAAPISNPGPSNPNPNPNNATGTAISGGWQNGGYKAHSPSSKHNSHSSPCKLSTSRKVRPRKARLVYEDWEEEVVAEEEEKE